MERDEWNVTLVKKDEIANGLFRFRLFAPELVSNMRPGQFVHVRTGGKTLRRPISICDVSDDGTFDLVFEVRGEGTKILSLSEKGEMINLLGPLGNGFRLAPPDRRALFVGGGIGVPPLLFAAKRYGKNASVLLGFREKSKCILVDDFKKALCDVTVTTEDGSEGLKGFVTAPLERLLKDPPEMVYACGPRPMLEAVAKMTEETGIPCQVSMEERMACGVGACLVCACKISLRDGKETYRHVCKDGPVFDARKVVW